MTTINKIKTLQKELGIDRSLALMNSKTVYWIRTNQYKHQDIEMASTFEVITGKIMMVFSNGGRVKFDLLFLCRSQ